MLQANGFATLVSSDRSRAWGHTRLLCSTAALERLEEPGLAQQVVTTTLIPIHPADHAATIGNTTGVVCLLAGILVPDDQQHNHSSSPAHTSGFPVCPYTHV